MPGTRFTRSPRSTLLRLAAAAALVAALSGTAAAQYDMRSRVDTTFAFGRNGWVDLSIVSGHIIVTGWTQTDIRVVGRIDEGTLETMFSGGRVGVVARGRRTSRSRSRTGDTRLELFVPVGTKVLATTSSGDIRIRGTGAEVQAQSTSGAVEVVDAAERVDVQTINGDVHLARIRGRTKLFTTNGDLTVDDLVGELQIKSVSSDLVLRGVQSSDVRIATTSGDITYGGPIDPKGSYEFTAHSGDVRLEVPAGTGANLAVQTYSGDIDSRFQMTLQPGENIRRTRGKRMEFTIGGGGASISVTTFSGDITISRSTSRPPRDQ